MILSSASDAHGRRTSSAKVLPRPRGRRSTMKAGHRSHRCSDDSFLIRPLSRGAGIDWCRFGRPLLLDGSSNRVEASTDLEVTNPLGQKQRDFNKYIQNSD